METQSKEHATEPTESPRPAQAGRMYDWLEKWRDEMPPLAVLEMVRLLAPAGDFAVAEIIPTKTDRVTAAAPYLFRALSDLYSAIDSAVELTPKVLLRSRMALALADDKRA